jgi:hypothetical protein
MRAALPLLLLLAACSGGGEDASDAAIANRAQSLEAAADATTDQLIREIDAQAGAEMAADPPPSAANSSQ